MVHRFTQPFSNWTCIILFFVDWSWYTKIGPARLRLSLRTTSPRAHTLASLPEHLVNSVVALVLTNLSGVVILMRCIGQVSCTAHNRISVGWAWEDLSTSRTSQDPSLSTVVCKMPIDLGGAYISSRVNQDGINIHLYLYRKSWARPTYLQWAVLETERLLFLVTGLYLLIMKLTVTHVIIGSTISMPRRHIAAAVLIYSSKLISEVHIKVDLSVLYQLNRCSHNRLHTRK